MQYCFISSFIIASISMVRSQKVIIQPNVYTLCEVDICAHGDDWMDLYLSTDAGLTYPNPPLAQVQPPNGWTDPMTYTYSGALTVNTRFRFEVEDSNQGPGGFIAQLTLSGPGGSKSFVTENPITNNFPVITTTGGTGTIINYVYTPINGDPWYILDRDTCLNRVLGGEWVWNNQKENTMTFAFQFQESDLIEICTTPEPTSAPSQDGCDFDLETYLEECYCDSSLPTPSPQPANVPIQIGIEDVEIAGFSRASKVNQFREYDGFNEDFQSVIYEFMVNQKEANEYSNNVMYIFIALNLCVITMMVYICVSYKKLLVNKGYIPSVQDSEYE